MSAVEPVEAAARTGVLLSRGGSPRPGAQPGRQARRPAGQPVAWPALLDALEERTRRLADVVETGAGEELPELALHAAGPLPAELQLRARVLLARTESLAEQAERRRTATERELRYRST